MWQLIFKNRIYVNNSFNDMTVALVKTRTIITTSYSCALLCNQELMWWKRIVVASQAKVQVATIWWSQWEVPKRCSSYLASTNMTPMPQAMPMLWQIRIFSLNFVRCAWSTSAWFWLSSISVPMEMSSGTYWEEEPWIEEKSDWHTMSARPM